MKQKVVYLQNLVKHVLKMSGYFQFHETNFVDALHCGDVLPPYNFCHFSLSKQSQNLQNISPLGVEVNVARAGGAVKKLRAMETYKNQKNRYQLCLLLYNNHVGLKNNERNYRTCISIRS